MEFAKVRSAVVLTLIAAITNFSFTGCAAGNFGFTRSVAKWNLKMDLLPRILIYILFVIIPVYPIAMLLDLILNNTVEFWTGHALVVAQNQTFYKDGYRVDVAHSANPLKKTVMTAYDKDGKVSSVVELRETKQKAIELYVDNVKKAEVSNIKDGMIQLLEHFPSKGHALIERTFEAGKLAGLDFSKVKKLVKEAPASSLAMRALQ